MVFYLYLNENVNASVQIALARVTLHLSSFHVICYS